LGEASVRLGDKLTTWFVFGLAFVHPFSAHSSTLDVGSIEKQTQIYLTKIIQPLLTYPANFRVTANLDVFDSDLNPDDRNCPQITADVVIHPDDRKLFQNAKFRRGYRNVVQAFVHRLTSQIELCKSVPLLLTNFFHQKFKKGKGTPYLEPDRAQLRQMLEGYLRTIVEQTVSEPEILESRFRNFQWLNGKDFFAAKEPTRIELRVAKSDFDLVTEPFYKEGIEELVNAAVNHQKDVFGVGKRVISPDLSLRIYYVAE
jgi:hypothetical protein